MGADIIDTPYSVETLAAGLKAQGVKTVIRYYNRQNTPRFPDKCLTPAEAAAIDAAGLAMAVVFQQNHRSLSDFTVEAAHADADRAVHLAAEVIGQPAGSTIYFAVDCDLYRSSDLKVVEDYFRVVHQTLAAGRGGRSYRVGVYGSGTVATRLLDAAGGPLVDHVWIAGATGWSGTAAFLRTTRWHLFQDRLDQKSGGIDFDTDILRAGASDFGSFRLGEDGGHDLPGRPVLMEVKVRSTLNLRGGPGTDFPVMRSLTPGTRVYAIERSGDWHRVDLEGDGVSDGYVNAAYLVPLAGDPGALPVRGRTAIDVALEELDKSVREVPGPESNPQITKYYRRMEPHATYNDDEISWCSYFVNYCVEEAGGTGTRQPNARSWKSWGRSVRSGPQRGDVAVFWRGSLDDWRGHVGFYWGEADDEIQVLGGNQGDAVSIRAYPKSRLLDIRRA